MSNTTCPILFSNSVSVNHQVRRLSKSELLDLQEFLIQTEQPNINELPTKYVLELVMKELERF